MIHNYITNQIVFDPLAFQLSHVSIVGIPELIGFIQRADNIPNLRVNKQTPPRDVKAYIVSLIGIVASLE
jgi:hypothetical protein